MSHSGSRKVKQRQKWGVSASDVAYHFGTSGISVATATGITHPLGKFSAFKFKLLSFLFLSAKFMKGMICA